MAYARTASAVRAGAVSGASVLAAAVLLSCCHPGSTASPADDPTSAVVTAAAWAAWALLAYLLAGVFLSAAARLPGALGTAAARLQPLVPAVVQRAVAVAAGTAVAASVAAPSTALAAGTAPLPPVAATTSPLDWPGIRAASVITTQPRQLLVRPGDTLWSLTARVLGPGASTSDVSATWPLLYAANRAVVGADPDLIRPGMRLSLPRLEERTPR